MDEFINYIANTFGNSNLKSLVVFFISILPIIEAKGGLLAASLMNIPVYFGVPIALLGNVFPVPFLMLFLKSVMKWMSKYKIFNKFLKILYNKVNKKKETIEKYAYWGLWFFVAIPLPGTGAYTGSLIASCLNMDTKKSTFVILFGTLCSVLVLAVIYYGLFGMMFK